MAARALRSKLSERIITHVMKDARITPLRFVKGLPPLAPQAGTKIAPLGRNSTISSTVPIKNSMFQSKAKSGPSLIQGRRNFSSGPSSTKSIPKIDSGTKGSSGPGAETSSVAEGVCVSSRSRFEEIADIFCVCAFVFSCYNAVMFCIIWRIPFAL